MFTVCPKCTLTLAVTAGDLRVGQGYVRCGRCSNVFNALLKLSDVPFESEAGTAEIPDVDPASASQITRALSGTQAPSQSPTQAPSQTPSAAAAPSAVPRPAMPPPAGRAPARQAPAGAVVSGGAARLPASASAVAAVAETAAVTGAQRSAAAAPSSRPAPSTKPDDVDAIGQFEVVLKTLGINLEEDPAAAPHAEHRTPAQQSSAARGTEQPGARDAIRDTPAVEDIVLEGDELNTGTVNLPEQSLDELDLFARRLSAASEQAVGWEQSPDAPGAAATHTPAKSAAGPAVLSPSVMAPRLARRAAMRARMANGAGGTQAPSATPLRRSGSNSQPESNFQPEASELAAAATLIGADLEVPGLSRSPLRYRGAWIIACALLVVLLIPLALSPWRGALARSPLVGAPLTHLYAALGMPIPPSWDLNAYEVRQQGAESEGGSTTIRVRFSLANHATHPQPVPMLRLTLLDRYGKRIGQRDLSPSDYWPHGATPATSLASDQRIDSSVEVRDLNADSASFELDVCLPDARRVLHCADDINPPLASTS